MKKLLLPSIVLSLILCSCGIPKNIAYGSRDVSGYVPTVANVNTSDEKGATQATGFLGVNHGEAMLNYNLSDHLYVQANTYLSGFYKNYDGAIGYTGSSKDNTFFSTHAIGYGYGLMNYTSTKRFDSEAGPFQGGRDHDVDVRKAEANYQLNRIYLQSTIGIRKDEHTLSVGGRLNMLYFTGYHYNVYSYHSLASRAPNYSPAGVAPNYVAPTGTMLAHKNSQVLDAFLTWNQQKDRKVNWYLQCLFSIPLNDADRHNEHHLVDRSWFPLLSAGLNLNLNFKKKS